MVVIGKSEGEGTISEGIRCSTGTSISISGTKASPGQHWTGFTRHFTHLKNGEPAKDKMLLLTAILADAINLGLTKMAEACAGATFARLSWLAAWHIRDETY